MGEDQHRYRTILKASSLIGGSAFINILFGMVRTKFVAVLLGPAGVGLMGMYTTILGPLSTITGLGLNSSGVRQIAEADGHGDRRRVGEVVSTLRRTVWLTGFVGFLVTAACSPWLSRWTFKTGDHALPIAVLGVTILFGNIAVGQSCVLQGMRRIGDLAKMQIVGSLNGTLISIPCYYLWGVKGIVPSLLLTSLANVATATFFARRVSVEQVPFRAAEGMQEVRRLLGFGLPLMVNGLQGSLVAFFLRLVLINQFGVSGVGVWEAAFAISGVLVNFVLSAMGTDYYPRLTSVAHDRALVSKEVNAQTEIALLLAAPALIATILFAPLGIHVLYTGKFDAAIPVLRWSVYGIFGRVVSWPMGFIMLAQGRGGLFLVTETAANLLYVGLIYVCAKTWGLPGAGVAFALLYVAYTLLMVLVSKRIADTAWTVQNVVLITAVLALLGGSSALHHAVASPYCYYPLASLLLGLTTLMSLKVLSSRTGMTLEALKGRFMRT